MTGNPSLKPRAPYRSKNSLADPLMQALAEDRVRRGMSQMDMALLVDKPQVSLQNWELGSRAPNLVKFRAMASAMGFDVVLVRRSDGKLICSPDDL